MAKVRVQIPDDVAAVVLFASDRTCCVCRLEKQKVQIHHIDEDPSNNSFDNLAVICLNCHSDAHSTFAFARSLSRDQIRLYNVSWRDIVKMRLWPTGALGQFELASEAFLEASLACHGWKNWFISLLGPNQLPQSQPGECFDVWDYLKAKCIPSPAEESYRHFEPLFDEGVKNTQVAFDRLMTLFADVLPADFRASLVRANRQLALDRSVYAQIPQLMAAGFVPQGQPNLFLQNLFVDVLTVLCNVARDADRRRAMLMPATEANAVPNPAKSDTETEDLGT